MKEFASISRFRLKIDVPNPSRLGRQAYVVFIASFPKITRVKGVVFMKHARVIYNALSNQ